MSKRLLLIKASKDICAAEIDHITKIADLFGMAHCLIEVASIKDIRKKICPGDQYDYIYLAAHANLQCFGESDGTCAVGWAEFAIALCELGCLKFGSVLLLGCCRGGLKGVANTLFLNCTQIDYVCGPRWTVSGADITAGFHIFVYNMEVRREQPSTAADRASNATGYDFFCYDRVETEDTFFQNAEI